jgi:pyruvate formate lyase activating enzyme
LNAVTSEPVVAGAAPAGLSPVADAIEQPSLVDYPGHLAGVFFVAGCNFRCGFCHNAALLGRPRPGWPWERVEAACRRLREAWADGAVVTGGEPTLHAGLPRLLQALRDAGFRVKLDTNGSHPDALRAVLPSVDYVAMDVKTAPADYPALAGFERPEAIAESVALVRARARDYEFRTTILPHHHDAGRMAAMAGLLHGARRWVLQPFVPRPGLPDPACRAWPRTPPERLRELRDGVRGLGLHVELRGA